MVERFPVIPDLTLHLRRLLAQVPAGRVTTCGDLAEALGNRIAARWVGHFALHHEHDADCPCHRILRAGGELGRYAAGSIAAKARKLAEEGVVVRQGMVDLERFGFREFVSDRPLEALRLVQEKIQRRISCGRGGECRNSSAGSTWPIPSRNRRGRLRPGGNRHRALVWSTTVRRRVTFPYISTYLSFREIPILLDLLDEVRAAGRMAEVLLVDGSGILHHRHAGIASHLGVVAVAADGRRNEEAALRPGGHQGDGAGRVAAGGPRRSVDRRGHRGRRPAACGRSSFRPAIGWTWPSARQLVAPAALRPPAARAALLGRPAEPPRDEG